MKSRIIHPNFEGKKRQLGFYFFPPLAGVVFLAILSLHSISDIHSNELIARHDRQAIAELNAVLEDMLNAETAYRGFLLTDDENYLEPFYVTKPLVKTHFENVRGLVEDENLRSSIDEAQSLGEEKLLRMNEGIDLAQEGKKAEALQLVVSGRGKEMMDTIRDKLRSVDIKLKKKILLSDEDSWNSYFKAIALASVAVSVAIISIVWSLLRVEKEFERRRISDGLVRQRSSQLQSFADIASRIVAGKDIDSILSVALHEFRQLIGAREALIQLKDGNKTRIERSIVASGVQNPSEDHLACIFEIVNAISHGEKTYFRHRPEILVLEKITSLRAWAVCGQSLDSMLSAPIVDGAGQDIGRFVLLGKFGEDFNANDVSIISQLAFTLSVAIDNAKLSEQARQAALRKDEFLAMLGHELRNPLAGILTGSEALLNEHGGNKGDRENNCHGDNAASEEETELLEAIYRQSIMMKHMVDDLLDVSRIGRGKITLAKTRCDIGQIVENLIRDYRNSNKSRTLILEKETDKSQLYVYGDPVRLAQSVTNLLHNACKFSSNDTSVRVRVVKEMDDLLGTQSVVIMVIDQGVGLNESELNEIFELFYQSDTTIDRSQGGLGIGLTLAKGLIDMHDGRLSASSTGKGNGATFTIRLPLLPDSEEVASKFIPAKASSSVAKPLTILAIDDRADALLPIKVLMSRDGHEVFEANDGEEGVELALKLCPDMILCDIGLPGKLDGYEVAQTIRRSNSIRTTYLVALSGYSQPVDLERSKVAGFDFHVAKPVDLATLRNLCENQPRFTIE